MRLYAPNERVVSESLLGVVEDVAEYVKNMQPAPLRRRSRRLRRRVWRISVGEGDQVLPQGAGAGRRPGQVVVQGPLLAFLYGRRI